MFVSHAFLVEFDRWVHPPYIEIWLLWLWALMQFSNFGGRHIPLKKRYWLLTWWLLVLVSTWECCNYNRGNNNARKTTLTCCNSKSKDSLWKLLFEVYYRDNYHYHESSECMGMVEKESTILSWSLSSTNRFTRSLQLQRWGCSRAHLTLSLYCRDEWAVQEHNFIEELSGWCK